MVEAFREKPGAYAYAGRIAGCGERTAKKGWLEGWAAPPWAATPISVILEREKAETRARIYNEEQAALTAKDNAEAIAAEKAALLRNDNQRAAIDAKAERLREAQAVRSAMSAALSGLAVSATVSRSRITLAQKAAEGIVDAASSGSITWKDAIPLLAKLQWLDQQAVGTMKAAMDALRMHTGDPKEFIASSGAPADQVDGPLAASALGGEDNLRQAILDLANNQSTPLAERLIEYQLESRRAAETPS